MARKPKEPAEASERSLPERVLKSISVKKLKELINGAMRTKAEVGEIVGSHREAIAYAVENHNLHKSAFADAKKTYALGQKDPAKLADHLDYRDHYEDVLGIRDLAATAPRLEMGDKPGEREEDDRGNVAAFPKAAE